MYLHLQAFSPEEFVLFHTILSLDPGPAEFEFPSQNFFEVVAKRYF